MTSSGKPPRNIIIIVVDSLRASSLDCYNGRTDYTPTLNAFAGEGTLFENTYCTWNTTDPSLTTILTGKYPISHGITDHGDRISDEHIQAFHQTRTRTLASLLHRRGFATFAVDWMGRWFREGFDFYDYEQPQNRLVRLSLYARYALSHLDIFRCYSARDKKLDSLHSDLRGVIQTFLFSRELAFVQNGRFVTELAIELIDSLRGKNFFGLLHYWDVHNPYQCPSRLIRSRTRDPKRRLVARYNGAVRFVDENLARLLDFLSRRKLLDDTLIIITSDHGESLTEHEIYFDHHGLYEVTTHVPLIVRYPASFPAGLRVGALVQHTDLVPTILDLLEVAPCNLDGQSLLPLTDGSTKALKPFAYIEEAYVQKKRAIVKAGFKYIYAPDGEGYCRYCHKIHQGPEELYDLQHDPHETHNIVGNNQTLAQELREELESFLNSLLSKRSQIREEMTLTADYHAETEEIKRKLKALGYIR